MAVTAQMFTHTCPTEIGEGLMYQISPKLVKNWKVWVEIHFGSKYISHALNFQKNKYLLDNFSE